MKVILKNKISKLNQKIKKLGQKIELKNKINNIILPAGLILYALVDITGLSVVLGFSPSPIMARKESDCRQVSTIERLISPSAVVESIDNVSGDDSSSLKKRLNLPYYELDSRLAKTSGLILSDIQVIGISPSVGMPLVSSSSEAVSTTLPIVKEVVMQIRPIDIIKQTVKSDLFQTCLSEVLSSARTAQPIVDSIVTPVVNILQPVADGMRALIRDQISKPVHHFHHCIVRCAESLEESQSWIPGANAFSPNSNLGRLVNYVTDKKNTVMNRLINSDNSFESGGWGNPSGNGSGNFSGGGGGGSGDNPDYSTVKNSRNFKSYNFTNTSNWMEKLRYEEWKRVCRERNEDYDFQNFLDLKQRAYVDEIKETGPMALIEEINRKWDYYRTYLNYTRWGQRIYDKDVSVRRYAGFSTGENYNGKASVCSDKYYAGDEAAIIIELDQEGFFPKGTILRRAFVKGGELAADCLAILPDGKVVAIQIKTWASRALMDYQGNPHISVGDSVVKGSEKLFNQLQDNLADGRCNYALGITSLQYLNVTEVRTALNATQCTFEELIQNRSVTISPNWGVIYMRGIID
uniref:Uncharacterized protein n=1 Tax=Pseudo-nitzschia sp. TaxID=1804765 RepID=A0A8T9DCN1_9STRA|nr:hypothetical protein LKZ67_pgp125 [Pseudo-nitzschia simulans]UBA15806.1 hypothetical protein [Pseudo-nitzschia sp.]